MGWNATVVVMNDSLDAIRNDPSFGQNLSRAIMLQTGTRRMEDVSALGHVNAASVIEQHHADNTAIVAVGGNYGSLLDMSWGYSHHEHDDQVRLLKSLAEKLGYQVRKKSGQTR